MTKRDSQGVVGREAAVQPLKELARAVAWLAERGHERDQLVGEQREQLGSGIIHLIQSFFMQAIKNPSV